MTLVCSVVLIDRYDQLKQQYPEEVERREKNRLQYRYPGSDYVGFDDQ